MPEALVDDPKIQRLEPLPGGPVSAAKAGMAAMAVRAAKIREISFFMMDKSSIKIRKTL
ncbi:MAG: hypothetical protein PHS92_00745 [Candidatus Gracilibacteria bacterium]|nr:hypothetical protein [Candidatus Gracilibacteria bacterium]